MNGHPRETLENLPVERDSYPPATNHGFEMKPRNLEEAMRFADLMAGSELVPQAYRGKPANILVAIQLGLELGLTPMRALRSIAVINGRPSMWGDDVLAMVLNSPVCEWVDESDSTDKQGVCKTKRVGHPEHVSIFTLEDARRAGLLQKPGPWQMHTARMLKLRARGFCLRDKYADVLAGLITTEEAMDLPVSDAIPAQAEQPPAPLTLKDKLKQQLEEPPAQHAASPESITSVPPASDPPGTQRDAAPSPVEDPSDPMHPDNLVHDFRRRIQGALTVAEATGQYNQAADLGCFLKSHLDGLKLALDQRIKELGKKK